jgi:hypothetical protein
MLKPIHDLPEGLSGVVAHGTVTKHDYEATLRPMLEQAGHRNEPIRLLYAFEDDFEGFTPEAAWEDLNLAFEHIHDVARCAVVADRPWLKAASQLAGALTPAQFAQFDHDEWDDAVAWLEGRDEASSSS